MEDSMSPRTLQKLVLLGLAVAIIPACGSTKSDAPAVVTFSPTGNGAPRCPIIYVQFNKPLKPATVTTANVFLDSPLVNEIITVTYNDTLNEIRIVPTTDLAPDTLFQITIMPNIESADGHFSEGEL